MIRFLASLNRPELDAAALDGARRLGEPVHGALADGLARRGAAAASHVPALRALGFKDGSWNLFYGLASSGTGGLGPLGAAILRERDPHAWGVLLRSSRHTGVELDAGLAVASVRSDVIEIRADTYWHLAIVFDAEKPESEALAAALGEAPEAKAEAPAELEAARALLVSTLAPLGVPTREGEKALLLLPERPEFLACVEESARLPLGRPKTVGLEEGQAG